MSASVVQTPNGNVPDGGLATWSGNPFSGNVTTGSCIVIAAGSLTSSFPVVSITDNLNAGNYTLFPGSLTTANARSLVWYYMPNTLPGSLSVTVHLSSAQSTSLFWGFEIGGLGSVPALDGAVTASFAATTSPSCGPLNTTNANDILLAVFRGGTFSAGGWTNVTSGGVNPGQVQYLIVGSTGAYVATATTTINAVGASAIAFQAAVNIPSVTTSSATAIGSTFATLQGTITSENGGGNSTSWGFNYGLTTAYGNSLAQTGSINTGGFGAEIQGLAPGILYHYRAFASNPNGTGVGSDATFTTLAGTHPGAGEVLFMSPIPAIFNGTTNIGSPNNLADANNETGWGTSSFHAWAGLDLGVPAILTRLRYTATPASEDAVIGASINANPTDVLFLSGNVNLYTFPAVRPNIGTLQNEVILPVTSTPYRYYNTQAVINHGFPFYDTDFIGQWVSGMYSTPVQPVISPPYANTDYPITVTITSPVSLSTVIYYTTDGSTPTNQSPLYTGPITISTTCKLQAIAYDQLLSTPGSRPTSAFYVIPSSFYSKHFFYDINRGYKMCDFEGTWWQDPVAKWWYRYGANSDLVSDLSGNADFGTIGQNIYRSADLHNWTYLTNVLGPPAGGQIGYRHKYRIRTWTLYNTNTQLYVMFVASANRPPPPEPLAALEVWTSPAPDGSQPWTQVALYTSSNNMADGNAIFDFVGDFCVFLDPVSGNAYIIYNYHTNSLTGFSQLDPANYTNTLGPSFTATYALASEAPSMMYHNGTYYLVRSGLYVQAYGENFYWTSTSPLGPWTGPFDPFQVIPGNVPPAIDAYWSQSMQCVFLPNRGPDAFLWTGSDGGNPNNNNAFNGVHETKLIIPIKFPTSTSMTITWILPGNWVEQYPNTTIPANSLSSPWNIDKVYPSVSPPLAATNAIFTGTTLTWQNNEPDPVSIYIDASFDPKFPFSGVISFPLGSATLAASPTSYVPTSLIKTWYRIRVVNVKGTSISNLAFLDPNRVPPVIVSSTGIYVIFSDFASYQAMFMVAGVDYSPWVSVVESGPYATDIAAYFAIQALI